jgi:hypothetical protein
MPILCWLSCQHLFKRVEIINQVECQPFFFNNGDFLIKNFIIDILKKIKLGNQKHLVIKQID